MKFALRHYGSLALIAAIPVAYLAFNPSFGENQAQDIDTWFYFGLAKSFWHYWGSGISIDYYETRLPYIIPAAFAFALPSDRLGAIVLSYVVYCVCCFSFLYTTSKWMARPTALLATILMASDIFFMRTVGWQYVDSGVLAYSSATFASLTASQTPDPRRRALFLLMSGFLSASMIVIHLGSAPLGIAFAGYAILVLRESQADLKTYLTCFAFVVTGAVTSLLLYGLLNQGWYHAGFFFEWRQVGAAKAIAAFFEPLGSLLQNGWWLTLHIAAWCAAAALIVATLARIFAPTPIQTYCIWTIFVTYSLLFLSDYSHNSLFLGRDGLYVSFYLFLSYLFVASLLPQRISYSAALLTGLCFIVCLAIRFVLGPSNIQWAPAWAVGTVLGGCLLAVALLKRGIAFSGLTAAILVLTFPVNWKFRYEPSIYSAREMVGTIARSSVPEIAFNEADPLYEPVIIGLVGSFTPRAWWMRCSTFPECLDQIISRRRLVLVSSEPDPARLLEAASSIAPGVRLEKAGTVARSSGDISIYRVETTSSSRRILASKLMSLVGRVEGSVRIATERDGPGYLAYGPYATLEPGRYEIVFNYQATGESAWDVISNEAMIASGPIPTTGSSSQEIARIIDLPNGATRFQTRFFYSGRGQLSLNSVNIRSLD